MRARILFFSPSLPCKAAPFFDEFTKQAWHADAVYLEQFAHEMIAQVTVGPETESLILHYLIPDMKINSDRQPQLRKVVEVLRNWIIEHLQNPKTGVEKFVATVFGPRMEKDSRHV